MNVNVLALMNGMHPDDTLRAGQRISVCREGASTHTVRRARGVHRA